VVERLPHTTIVVMGLPDARPYADAIVRATGAARCIDFTGKTASLREVVTLLAMGRVLVTNDSGPAHIAALTAIRNVVLFGPETPKLYGPLGDHATPLYAGLACSPCVGATNHRHTVCRDNKCLQAIAVGQVLDVVVAAVRA
jgi:ADP-heptose:LPS heptosyltransferase